ALLALAARRTVRWPIVAAVGAGLLLGWGIFLNYGLALMALPAVAVLLAAVDWRGAVGGLVAAGGLALGGGGVVGGGGVLGVVAHRYWQGIANDRPFQYWWWANLAAVVCAIGLGSVAGIGRAFDVAAIRRRPGLYLVILGALLAILWADLSMLSKAETERIWL